MYVATAVRRCPIRLEATGLQLTLRYLVHPPDRDAGIRDETIEVLDATDAAGVSRSWEKLAAGEGCSLEALEAIFTAAAFTDHAERQSAIAATRAGLEAGL